MKIMIPFILLMIVVICVLGACTRIQVKDTEMIEEPKSSTVTAKNIDTIGNTVDSYEELNYFSYNLFHEIADEENAVISPISAYLALSMAGFGADGDTKSEFHMVLGKNMTEISDRMMKFFPKNTENMTLSLANSAWLDTRFAANQTWLKTIHTVTDAETFQMELSDIDAKNRMNCWVAEKTNGLIEQMVEEPFDKNTGLVFLNALYFKAKWKLPFESHMTNTENFYLANGERVKVDMMHKNNEQLEYISNAFAEGVILPYTNDYKNDAANDVDLALIALKSKEGTSSELHNKITAAMISDLLDHSQTQMVNLKLPKFEVTLDKTLNEILQNMGLKTCFDIEKADFSQIGEAENGDRLYIDLVRQKAKIIVDEEGTEAAVATEVAMKYRSALPVMDNPIEVFFDEPFIYMIMDMEKKIPLFVGRMDNPTAKN